MSAPPSPRHPEWPQSRVPKLGYRKAIPEDEVKKFTYQLREPPSLADNFSRNDSTRDSVMRSSALPTSLAPTRKKNPLFGGLFVKEPTLTALAQVEADLKAKHGAATPQNVPHVSSRKMPEHVPKVNQKWDGVPDAVKKRDHDEKARKRMSLRSDRAPGSSERSRSIDGSTRNNRCSQFSHYRRDSDIGSWQSPADTIIRGYRPGSLYSLSSEDSQEVVRGRVAPSVRSQSLRSPSGTSLPEITSFFPHHGQPPVPSVPQRWQSVNSTNTNSTKSSDQSQYDYSQGNRYVKSMIAMPEHSSSPITTPREMSPVTPGYAADNSAFSLRTVPASETSSSSASQHTRHFTPGKIDAFLAGEARPLEVIEETTAKKATDLPLRRFQQSFVDRVEPDIARRPDSSRARLGLRASMVVRTEAAPWETQDPSLAHPSFPGSAQKARFSKGLKVFKS